MDNNEIEIGLLREKIKQELSCMTKDRHLEAIEKYYKIDIGMERLVNVLNSLEQYKQKQERELSQREYWQLKKREINNIEYRKDCDYLGKIK